jgi:hypothetical protein
MAEKDGIYFMTSNIIEYGLGKQSLPGNIAPTHASSLGARLQAKLCFAGEL